MYRTIKNNIQKCFIAGVDDLFINKEDLLENPVTRADLPINQELTNKIAIHNLTSESPTIYMYENKSHAIENNETNEYQETESIADDDFFAIQDYFDGNLNDEIPEANASNEIENIKTNSYQVAEINTDDDFSAIKEFMSHYLDDQIPEANASKQYSSNILNHPLNKFW